MTLPKTDRPDDAQLVDRLKGGDLAALDALYHRYADQLMAVAYRLTGSADDAEDVVQDVFVGLPVALRRYVDRDAFQAWLRTVTTRVALNRIRSRGRRREVPIDGSEQIVSARTTSPPERAVILNDAIAALPDELRTVFVLREIEGYTHAEIAEMLGIRRGTSEVRLFRAIRRLRRTLGDAE
jgi:RNA polymerase sigma-70 factor (ECF subfamily)